MATHLSNRLRAALDELLVTSLHARGAGRDTGHDPETRVVALAVEHLNADLASITQRRRDGSLSTIASSDPVVARLEQLQQVQGQGPIFDSLDQAAAVVAPDLSVDPRWPRWCRSIAGLGARGVITVRLEHHSGAPRVLNLYSSAPHVLTLDDVDLAQQYAHQAGVAVRVIGEVMHLYRAIDHRTVIGQAEGLLMEKFQIDADRAFAALKRVSSQTNPEAAHRRRGRRRDPHARPAPVRSP